MGPVVPPVNPLHLQRVEEALDHRVIVAVSPTAHAAVHPPTPEALMIDLPPVL